MDPLGALYGRQCRSPIKRFEIFEVTPWGTNMIKESMETVIFIQEKLITAQSRQKEYADKKVRDMMFEKGESYF